MNPETFPSGRKRRLPLLEARDDGLASNEMDVTVCATVYFSAEDPNNPLEHLFDKQCGVGARRWASDRENISEQIVLEFDGPTDLARLLYACEETQVERTQEIRVDYSRDGGASYTQVLVQEYNFSPNGSTFQREDLRLDLKQIDHLRFTIVPNKSGTGRATMTCIRLFS